MWGVGDAVGGTGRCSICCVEDLVEFLGEGFGLASLAELATQETAVVAGEHRGLLA